MELGISNHTLDEYVRQDPRILDVYLDARNRYGQLPLYHHGFHHVLRDLYRALLIAKTEEGVDYSVLIPSVLLHDIGFCSQDFQSVGHDVAGARLAQEILEGLGYDEETCRSVSHCIRAHKGKAETPQTLEAKILFDADKLDSIGAIGIARAFQFAGEVGAKFHNPDLSPEETRPYTQEDTGYREFKLKLSKVKDRLLTAEGRRMAEERHAFMEKYFERFFQEYEGEK